VQGVEYLSSNDLFYLTLFIFIMNLNVLSHQINEFNSIETNDDSNVRKRNDNIMFILIYNYIL
jgi:hypothetical protein